MGGGAWLWYQAQLAASPVRTQLVTSGILWAVGDLVAQKVSSSLEQKKPVIQEDAGKINWAKVGISSMFGVGFVGPVGHFWYEGLEFFVKKKLKLRPNSLAFVTTKLAADGLIFGPIHLLAFFTYTGLASGKSVHEVKQLVSRDFVPAFFTEGAVWPMVQVVNFRFVPLQHQLLYVNFFCLLDSAFLSWFKYQDDAPWKRRLKDIVQGK